MMAALIDLTTGLQWNMTGSTAVQVCMYIAATYTDFICVVQHMA